MNSAINYTLQFIIGGSVLVVMSFFAKHIHPKYAAVVYAIPAQFTLAAILIYLHTSKQTVQELSKASLLALGILALFIVSFLLFSSKFSFWISIGASYVIFAVLAILMLLIYR